MKLQSVLFCQFGNEFGIGVTLAAPNLMVEVNNRDNDPQFLSYLQHRPQQRNRVGTAGNGDPHPLTSMDKTALSNVVKELLKHGEILHRVKRETQSPQRNAKEHPKSQELGFFLRALCGLCVGQFFTAAVGKNLGGFRNFVFCSYA